MCECIGDLMFIENQNSENSKKEKLKNVLKITSKNLEKYPEKEKRMLINYNGIKNEIENNINNYKGNNEKKYPLIIKNKFEIDNDLIERCDLYQAKFLEYMILKGSFYSDFNIFQIYDIFIDEMSNKIMEEEIKNIINKADVIVDNICNEEINEINNNN